VFVPLHHSEVRFSLPVWKEKKKKLAHNSNGASEAKREREREKGREGGDGGALSLLCCDRCFTMEGRKVCP